MRSPGISKTLLILGLDSFLSRLGILLLVREVNDGNISTFASHENGY